MDKDTSAIVASNLTIAYSANQPGKTQEQIMDTYRFFLAQLEADERASAESSEGVHLG